ncbi:Hypothetical predicted protein, partial [Marmota monax]
SAHTLVLISPEVWNVSKSGPWFVVPSTESLTSDIPNTWTPSFDKPFRPPIILVSTFVLKPKNFSLLSPDTKSPSREQIVYTL